MPKPFTKTDVRVRAILAGKPLTTREAQVRALLASGNSAKGIARALNISKGTADYYSGVLLRLSGAKNRFQLACWAITGDPMAAAKKLTRRSIPKEAGQSEWHEQNCQRSSGAYPILQRAVR